MPRSGLMAPILRHRKVSSVICCGVRHTHGSGDVLALPTITVPGEMSVPENASANTLVTTLKAEATAPDSVFGAPVIINANPAKYPFVIVPKSETEWELITSTLPKLDFETVPLYMLQILVKDSKGSSASQMISIKVTDINEAPVFTGTLAYQDAEVYVPEDTVVGSIIYRVAAKDPDKDVLKYSITSGDTGFVIDNTGVISSNMSFDFDTAMKSYIIAIKVDDGALFITGNVKVFLTNANDNSPALSCIFSSISNGVETTQTETSGLEKKVQIKLDEELPIGRRVATCAAIDEDFMNDLTYRLEPGNPYFAIDKGTGTVIIISRLDLETTGFLNTQSFAVKVCDKDLQCAAISVIAEITEVNDNSPFCSRYLYSYTSPEPIAANTIVATLNCEDLDKPPNALTYTPISGPIGTGKLFEHVAGSPTVIMLMKDLDYDNDTITTYEMMVSVSDSGIMDPTHTVTTTIIVSVTSFNEFPPVFNPATYSFKVPETSGAGYVIGKVTATDQDKPEDCVKYKIIHGETELIHRFWIDPVSGTMKLMTHPDYETVKRYTLTVEAKDCDPVHPLSAVANVTIDITEENDEAPRCKPPIFKAVLFDNATAGMNINGFKLSCKDRDSDDTAMRFEIVSGNVNNHFGFDPTHGSPSPKLIVRNPFHFDGADVQQNYHLVVYVIDDNLQNGKATRPRTGTVQIDLRIIRTSIPVAPTSFESQDKLYEFNSKSGPEGGRILGWGDSRDEYEPGNVNNHFGFDPTHGSPSPKLIVRNPFHFDGADVQQNYHLVVYVIDDNLQNGKATRPRTGTVQIDLLTGQLYEFNSKSGARRWKDTRMGDSKEMNTNLAMMLSVPENPLPLTPQKPTVKD
ncbi:cadherin-related family member 3-like [Microcaecilia unicolor]|uniref:Cadherin-related family member 3-like n=1 Tax=Microcaecilia unicolor TaxID=1415580 RepID=A0A6P7YC51_9AMPH|nr:cadherin-related family member 3-like [Microcaecilia unicolor]